MSTLLKEIIPILIQGLPLLGQILVKLTEPLQQQLVSDIADKLNLSKKDMAMIEDPTIMAKLQDLEDQLISVCVSHLKN